MSKLSKEASAAHMQQWGAYMQEHQQTGAYLGGAPLKALGAQVSAEEVVKEPAGKGKRRITGYMLLEARTLVSATKIAKSCPILSVGGTVEVRPIQPM